ncbi:hypothetical protein B7C62_01810 [Kitasatospora albolonga]|uniref:SMP-30/Gluconolactonase/LRE-like region domain-containing protein n=1 Tax=Kitasatospora albolonga TaxID=68173 RepID=A0ABC8BL88_9ACTN|nr:hypothetical protein B7C62_01810 [Kitasatospora albolonga]
MPQERPERFLTSAADGTSTVGRRPPARRPHHRAADPTGTLYVADFSDNRVVELPVRGGPRTPAGLSVPQPGHDA